IISASERPRGLKSDPPLPPPIGSPVRAFLKVCSKPRNLMIPTLTDGWKRKPPLYGPTAELNWPRNPRLMRRRPRSEEHTVELQSLMRTPIHTFSSQTHDR